MYELNWICNYTATLCFPNSKIKLLKDSIFYFCPCAPMTQVLAAVIALSEFNLMYQRNKKIKELSFYLKFGHYQNRLRPAVTLFVAGPADSPLTRYLQVRSMPSLRSKKTPDFKKRKKKLRPRSKHDRQVTL